MIARIQKKLLVQFLFYIILTLILVFLFETDSLTSGFFVGNKTAEFYSTIIMELLSLAMIPVALKFWKINFIAKQFSFKNKDEKDKKYYQGSSLRINILCLPMLINTFLYYGFMNVAFGYLGIILMLCLFFIYPSKQRCNAELSSDEA